MKLRKILNNWSIYVFSLSRYFLVWCLPIFSISDLYSQEISPIQNYDYQQYHSGSQNWSITQTNDKHMFFGNNNGLLEFDGQRWKQYATPNGTIVRSVYADGDVVYTGCYMDFGFWKRDSFGHLQYTSLIDKIGVPLFDDEHFWSIRGFNEWIIFQSLDRVYLYNKTSTSIRAINFKSQRGLNFDVNGRVLFQKRGEGLFEIQNGEMQIVSSLAELKDNLIVGIYPLNGQLVLIFERGEFKILKENDLDSLNTQLIDDDQFLIYSSLQLSNGDLVLGTVSGGYYRMSDKGILLEHVNQEKGLRNNTVLSAYQDVDNNLWLALDNGISNVNIDSAFKEYFDVKGNIGLVYTTKVFNGMMYLGTNQGLFAWPLNSNEDFKMVEGTNGQVWNLHIIDNSLFCAHTAGTFLISGYKSDHFFRGNGTWTVQSLPGYENMLIQGNYDGLSMIHKIDGKWTYRNKITGFSISCRFLESLNGQDFFVNHEHKGIFKIELDNDFRVARRVSFKDRLGFNSSLIHSNGQLLYACNEGVYTIESSNFQFIRNQRITDLLYDSEDPNIGRLIADQTKERIWGVSERSINCLEYDSFDGVLRKKAIPISSFFKGKKGLVGFEHITEVSDDKYIVGLLDGYMLMDMSKLKEKEFLLQLDQIVVFDRKNTIRFLDKSKDNQLPYAENNLKASFTIPNFDRNGLPEFQYKLEGFDSDYSEWSSRSEVEYRNLPYGLYSLKVKGRLGESIADGELQIKFEVKRPWYWSFTAIASYIIFLALLLFVIHKGYRGYYKKQQKKLIEENQRALDLAHLEKEQEIMMIKNDQLKSEIEHKNRELASTAMNLVHKNEVLHNIKSELLNHPDTFSKQDVVKVIDKNIDGNKDWEQFKKTFNETDKGFLKKMHKLHTNLTPNDLKLCVYLRLNLSSKEIAPLLNISVRSVEIKRYRLRKKMGLEHEKSLVEYILEV